MKFCERFNELLKKMNIRQSEVCQLSNIPSSLISNYSTGRATPSLENAIAMSDALNISLDTLVGRVERCDKGLLTPEENQVLRKFRELNDNESLKKEFLGYLDFLGYKNYQARMIRQ